MGQLLDLTDSHNLNKITRVTRGLVLLANLFGRARDLGQNVRAAIMESDGAVPLVIESLYKRESLPMTSLRFSQLKSLLSCRSDVNETEIAIEARLAARLSKFNNMEPTSALPECMAAYYLLGAAYVDDSQCIAIMAAAPPKDASVTPRSLTGSFFKAVTCERIVSVLLQCEKVQKPVSASTASTSAFIRKS